VPSDVFPIKKMTPIVWDLSRAGAFAETAFNHDSTQIKLKTTTLFQEVFDLYGVTKDDFYKSYRYYESHPSQNKILMDSVTAYANRERTDLYKSKAVTPIKPKQDSIALTHKVPTADSIRKKNTIKQLFKPTHGKPIP
jgi:hypothetical protein